MCLGEEDTIEVLEGEALPAPASPVRKDHSPVCKEQSPVSKEYSPVNKEHSPKPAELLKDLQSTVHQAKTKIGDLQVPPVPLHVPRNQCSGVC